jgi:hypothetical protein
LADDKPLCFQQDVMARYLHTIGVGIMRSLFSLALLSVLAAPVPASTLRQLSLDDMIRQSTVIVRGTAQPTTAAFAGSLIFTHYRLQVTETLKGTAASQIDVVVPGGQVNGANQRYAGAPTLSPNQDYVLFLWTSKSGLTQVIGLSQGLFSVLTNSARQPLIVRASATERMVDASGQPVTDSDIQMLLSDLRSRIQTVLSAKVTK